MKTLLAMTLSAATVIAAAQSPGAPAAPAVEVHAVSSVPAVNGSNENFTGVAHISAPFKVQAPGRAGGATVRFEARARTAWHTHPLGQTLIVTAGLGLVQQQGQPARVIRPGDVVTIAPNVRHWHGAGPDAAMTHVAIAEREDGISVAWQDKVSDEDYRAALADSVSDVGRARAATGGFAAATPSPAPASAARQVHVGADLCARAHGGPGVHHGAFAHVGADVHVRRHQDRALGDEAATAGHGGGYHAHAGGLHLVFGQVGEFGLHLVIKAQVAGLHHGVVLQAEGQQHGLLDPLVHGPLAHAFAGGHAQLAVVQLGDHLLDGVQDVFGGCGGREAGAVVPGVVDEGLQLLDHGRRTVRLWYGIG